MIMKDIKALDDPTLQVKLGELKANLLNIRLGKTTTGIEKYNEYKNTKKDIARMLTELNHRGKK